LEVDVLALALIRIESVEGALHDEARESDELSEGTDLLFGGVPKVSPFYRCSFTYLRYILEI
jgi:hypothetical protein